MMKVCMALKKAMSLVAVFMMSFTLFCTAACMEAYAAEGGSISLSRSSVALCSKTGSSRLLSSGGNSVKASSKKAATASMKKTVATKKATKKSKKKAETTAKKITNKVTASGKKVKNSGSVPKASTAKSNGTATVTGCYTNLRQGSGTGYAIICKLTYGKAGSILKKSGAWYQIKADNSKIGWVNKKYIKVTGYKESEIKKESEKTNEPPANRIIITASSVNVYHQPSVKTKRIGKVRKNEVYDYLKSENGWYIILTPSGKEGYLRKQYTRQFNNYAINGGGDYIWPTQTARRISCYFKKGESGHKGLDIAAPGGSQILAVASGKVLKKGYSPNGLGYFIVIKQENGLRAYYAHMQKDSFLNKGDKVKAGDMIGIVGTSGRSTGNHLHLEFRNGSEKIDPLQFFPKMARKK